LISIDYDSKLLEIAQKHLGSDTRLSLECIDGEAWVKENLNVSPQAITSLPKPRFT